MRSQQIAFGVMSPDEIIKGSELQVYERSLYKVICELDTQIVQKTDYKYNSSMHRTLV